MPVFLKQRSSTTKVRDRFNASLLTLCLALLANNSFAMPDTIPTYSISPSLNTLNIAYFAKQDKIKIRLYVVNHERFPVICDTQYQSGPDTRHSLEQTVLPEKSVAFSYNYSRKGTAVNLQLQCDKPKTETAKKLESPSSSSVQENDLSTTH